MGLDFDSVRQAPGYLLSKAEPEIPPVWNEEQHPRKPDGTFSNAPSSKSEDALRAVLAQPVLDADSLSVLNLPLIDALLAGRHFFEGMMERSPVKCPAIGFEDVVFDEHGWKYITDESYARQFNVNKDRGGEEVKLRLSLLPKAVAAIVGAVSLEGPARVDHCTRRYPIIARFKDGDVIRVILEEHQEGNHRFLSVFDLERVAKKLKRVAGPDSLHKSSRSTVQGAATGDGLYTCIVGDSVVYVNEFAKTEADYDSLAKSAVYVARYPEISRLKIEPPDSLAKADTTTVRYRSPEDPTEAQIKAGNYPKRQVPWHGMTISIENEAGSTRDGNTMIYGTKRTKPLQGYSRTHHLPEVNRCDRLPRLRR